MTAEQFRALLKQHGGLLGTEIVDKSKEEEIAGVKTGELVAPTTIRVRYTTPNGEIVARQRDDGSFDILDDPKGLVKAAASGTPAGAKPGYHTLPNGDLAVEDPAAPGGLRTVATKPQGPPTPAKGTLPRMTAPARAAGQRTDLGAVTDAANAYLAQLNADTSIDDVERHRRWAAYLETTVRPAREQATREINEEADRLRTRQEAADVRAQATTERQTSTAEQTAGLARAQFEYGAGQDAVKNAISLLQYQHNPAFLKAFADATGTLSRGGGAVSIDPSAFQIQGPDINALAEQGAQRAAAMYRTPAGVPFSPRPGVGAPVGVGPGAISSSSGATQAALQQAPFTPRPALPPPVSVGPPATVGVPVGTPSPLPPGWEQTYPQPAAY